MANGAFYCNRCGTQNSALAMFCASCGDQFPTESQQLSAPTIGTLEIAPQPGIPAWQARAVSPPTVPAMHYGGFWIRFIAALIDGVLVGAVIWPVSLMIAVLIRISGTAVAMPGIGVHLVNAIVSLALSTCANWIYEAAMESSSKQATIGKMVLALRVTDLEGRRISFTRATGRHFAKIISAMILLIGYIMAGFTERKQALHDILAGTLVQRTR